MKMPSSRTMLLACFSIGLFACAADENKSEFSVRYFGRPQLAAGTLDVSVSDRAFELTTNGVPLNKTDTVIYNARRSQPSGDLSISFVMKDGSTTLSTGGTTVQIRGDWIWEFDLTVDSLNPARLCFGCTGSKSFALSSAYQRNVRDSVWLTWGGGSIAHPTSF